MKLLWRILFVLTFALLGMQSASACERAHAQSHETIANASQRSMSAHSGGVANIGESRPSCHSHSLCCMTMCGAHCGALLSGSGLAVRLHLADLPPSHSEPSRASVTRAPPVRPPIV